MAQPKEKYHHGNLRLALINAGQQLLIEKGITGLSLRETAKTAGVSHTAPYRHFKDKDMLLAAIAESGFETLAEALQNASESYPSDPEKQLTEAAVAYVKLAITRIEMHQLMFGSILNEDSMSESMLEKKQMTFNTLFKIIEHGQKRNIYLKAETHELTVAAWSIMHGYALLISSGQLREAATTLMQIETLARAVTTHLVKGLVKA